MIIQHVNKKLIKQSGFSLVELMIALTLGLFIMSGTLSVVTSTLATNTSALTITRLNQELRAVMVMLTRDLRRAGHWGLAADVVRASFATELELSATSGTSIAATINVENTSGDPLKGLKEGKDNIIGLTLKHVGAGGDIGLATITGYEMDPDDNTKLKKIIIDIDDPFPSTTIAAGTWSILNPFSGISLVNDLNSDGVADDGCILFSYDINSNGLLDDNERYGFRLDTDEKTIEIRQAGASCTDGGWQNLTDERSVELTELRIENLSPSITAAGYSVTVREFSIMLAGRLKSDAAVERTLRETIKIRNNEVF